MINCTAKGIRLPVVSVIIPTYNRAALLREALDSVARQTYRDYEVIVVDDGSTEDVAAIVAAHVTRPALIRRERGGPAAARNAGVAASSGRLLAFLDSDDLWLEGKLARFVAHFDANPTCRICYGPMQPMDAARRPVAGRTKPCHRGRITDELFHSSFVHVPAVVMTRALFDEFAGFNESLRVCEDYDLWLRISVRQPFDLIDEPLALRRLHDDRLSKSCMARNLAVKVGVLDRFLAPTEHRAALDLPAAHARVARVALAAARAGLRHGRFRCAADMLRVARRHGAGPLRIWPLLAAAGLLSGLERADERPVSAAADVGQA